MYPCNNYSTTSIKRRQMYATSKQISVTVTQWTFTKIGSNILCQLLINSLPLSSSHALSISFLLSSPFPSPAYCFLHLSFLPPSDCPCFYCSRKWWKWSWMLTERRFFSQMNHGEWQREESILCKSKIDEPQKVGLTLYGLSSGED